MAQQGGKKRGLPPIKTGPTMMAPPPPIPTDPDGDKENLSTFDEQALVIDANLLVGPVYDNSKQRAKALKEQLGDINTRLQTTLTTFDTVNPFDQDEDMLGDLDKHVNGMEAGQMKATLKHFINNYRDMSSHITSSTQEREDVLFQLSDWFTMDHLDDLEGPPSSEEDQATHDKNYSEALFNLEKFKRLQTQIQTASGKGANVEHLMAEKRKLEHSVLGGMKHLKKGKQLPGGGGGETWRHAADEVVGMLRRVRAESTEEQDLLKKKVNELVLDLQQKQQSIETLRKDARDKKTVMQRFVDENADLTDDVAKLKFRIKRLEVDMENATKLLENKIDLNAIQLSMPQEASTGKDIKVTLSFIMKQLGVVTDANNLKRLTSDPALLRKQIRENNETIEAFSRELIKLKEQVKDLQDACKRKDVLLVDLETVNNQLRDKLVGSASDMSVSGIKMTLSSHSSHSKNHPSSRMSIVSRSSSHEGRPKPNTDETDKLYRKLDYFRKALADAEMRLSGAYKEMADMRRRSLAMDFSATDLRKSDSSDEEDKTFKFEGPDNKDKKKIIKEPKKPKKAVRRKSIKPKSKKEKALPPIPQPTIPEPEEPPLPELEDDRENTLWKVADIQGRLNMLLSAIMSFANDVGKLIEGDPEEAKQQQFQMQQFQFGQTYEDKAAKNAANQKLSEARQRKGQVMLSGQRACAILRESYDLLSGSLNLQHDDYEQIYRSFKKHQQIRAVHHAAMMGRLPGNNNLVRMGSSENAVEYYLKSYGGAAGAPMAGQRPGVAQTWEVGSSRAKDHPGSNSSSRASIHSASGMRMEEMFMMSSIKRSKSDLQLHDQGLNLMSQPLRTGERAQVFVVGGNQDIKAEVVGINKEEVALPTATVPKKGLIKLTSQDDPQDGEMYKRPGSETGENRRKSEVQKTLIKRKDIRDHIRDGTRMLEEEEEMKRLQEEAEEANIEDYTLVDLQTALSLVQGDEMPGIKKDIQGQALAQNQPQGQQKKAPKEIKAPTVTESIKQQTFQLPFLGAKK